jgi:hypothetical protein
MRNQLPWTGSTSGYGLETEMIRPQRGERIVSEEMGRLRQETTTPLKWIADRSKMATSAHAANRLYQVAK